MFLLVKGSKHAASRVATRARGALEWRASGVVVETVNANRTACEEIEGDCRVTGSGAGRRPHWPQAAHPRWVSRVYVLRCASMTRRASRPQPHKIWSPCHSTFPATRNADGQDKILSHFVLHSSSLSPAVWCPRPAAAAPRRHACCCSLLVSLHPHPSPLHPHLTRVPRSSALSIARATGCPSHAYSLARARHSVDTAFHSGSLHLQAADPTELPLQLPRPPAI